MLKSQYVWHITFSFEGIFNEITIQETHPDFKKITAKASSMLQASLIDLDKICYISEEYPIDAIIYSINFEDGVILDKVFRRVEKSILDGRSRTIPALEYTSKKGKEFIFCYKDKLIRTKDRRFFREDWDNGTE